MSDQRERQGRVLLAVCGGIAAYKACEVLRGLQKEGCEVRVTMTADAERFVGAATFSALSGSPVADSLYDNPSSAIPHIELSEWADVVVVVPATANVLAKLACGIADDALTTFAATFNGTTLLAPAMNPQMWQHSACRENVETLRRRGVLFAGPAEGHVACGPDGPGRMVEPAEIFEQITRLLERSAE